MAEKSHTQTNTISVAALTVGIAAFVTSPIPFWGLIAGITAIVLGIIGLRSTTSKGLSVVGIVTGGVAVLANIIIGTLLLLGFLAVGLTRLTQINFGLDTQARTLATIQQKNEVLLKQLDAKKDFSKGETAQFGVFSLKINTVTRNFTPTDTSLTPSPGKEFILVNVTAKNTTDKTQYINSTMFNLDNNGVTSAPQIAGKDPMFRGGPLNTGESYTANLMYEATKGSQTLKLKYEERITSTNSSDPKILICTLAI